MKHILTTMAITALIALSAHGQHGTPNWSIPHYDFRDSFSPTANLKQWPYSNIAVTTNDKRVVMVERVNPPNQGIYLVNSYDGITWNTPLLFNPALQSGADILFPKMQGDKNGKLHFVWHSNALSALFYTQLDTAFNVLIDSVRIADNSTFGIYVGSFVTIDRQGRIHIMWHEGDNINQSQTSEAFYCRSIDGGNTFSSPSLISNDDGKNSAWPWAEYSAYNGDTLMIAWRDQVSGADWDIQYVLSYNGGVNWTIPHTLDSQPGYQADPDVVISPDGSFHVFTHETPFANTFHTSLRMYHRMSNDRGQSWTSPIQLSANERSLVSECSRYDLTTNTLWTFYKESGSSSISGDLMAVYSTNNGVTWSSPEYFTDEDTLIIGQRGIAFLTDGRPVANYEVPYGSGITVKFTERLNTPLSVPVNNVSNAYIQVFPNPANENIAISIDDSEKVKIDVFDVLGKHIYSFNNITNTFNLNTSSLKNGIYYLHIYNELYSETEKIIIQH